MRVSSVLLIVLLLSLSAPALAQHPGAIPSRPAAAPADNLSLLREAHFITVSGLTGVFPHGSFELNDGVLAILPGEYMHGLALGRLAVDFSSLPGYTPEDGALNLFREIDGPDSTVAFFDLAAAYISAALDSGFSITDEGTVTAERGWGELSGTERARFEQAFAQCASDGWTEPGSAALREPAGSETFAALWTAGEDGTLGTRWDFRADADGNLSIEEYARGITWYEYPWAREEGDTSSMVYFKSIDYEYTLETTPASDSQESPYGRVAVTVWAELRLIGAPEEPEIGSPEHDATQPLTSAGNASRGQGNDDPGQRSAYHLDRSLAASRLGNPSPCPARHSSRL